MAVSKEESGRRESQPESRGYFGDEDNTLRNVSLSDLMRPGNWWTWFMGFAEGWCYSREFMRLLQGLPFALAAAGTLTYTIWLKNASDAPVIARVEREINAAVEADDEERIEYGLKTLMSLRPSDQSFRFRMGVFLLTKHRQDGLAYMMPLLAPDANGYTPARRWIVNQALLEEPYVPLTEDDIERQLLLIQREAPDDSDIARRLADVYLKRSEWRLAEQSLNTAVRTYPVLSLSLARVKKQLGRPESDIITLQETGLAELQSYFSANRQDSSMRKMLAEALASLGRLPEARSLLQTGLQETNDPMLSRALSDFDLQVTAMRLQQSPLNRDVGVRNVLQVIARQPDHPGIIPIVTRVHSMGARFEREQLQSCINHWSGIVNDHQGGSDETELNRLNDARLNLSQLYVACNALPEAIELLQVVAESRPQMRVTLARLYAVSGDSAAAQTLTKTLLEESELRLSEHPKDENALQVMLECYAILQRPMESIDLVRRWCESANKPLNECSPIIQTAFGTACLRQYGILLRGEQSSSAENSVDSANTGRVLDVDKANEMLLLLDQAITIPATQAPVIVELARLSWVEDVMSAPARDRLRKLRTAGDPNGQIHMLMGTQALLAEKFTDAILLLDTANAIRSGDPSILNNLAIALCRSEPPNLERALQEVDRALAIVDDQSELHATRGEILLRMERWTEACNELLIALPDKKNDALTHELLVTAFTELGKMDMAEAHKARLIELSQD
ncbi:MAG: hypothetical protein R3C20_12530 [Planctomycetaceae bacterium]